MSSRRVEAAIKRHDEIIDFIFKILSDDGTYINRERLAQFMLRTDVLNPQCKSLRWSCREAILKIVYKLEHTLVKSDLIKCLHDIHKWMIENPHSSGVFQPGGQAEFSTRLSAFVSDIESKGNFNEIKNDLKYHDRSRPRSRGDEKESPPPPPSPRSRGEPIISGRIISRRRHDIHKFIFKLLSDDDISVNRKRLTCFLAKTNVLTTQCKHTFHECYQPIIESTRKLKPELDYIDLVNFLLDTNKWLNENESLSGVWQPGEQFYTKLYAFVSEIRSKGNFNYIKKLLKDCEVHTLGSDLRVGRRENHKGNQTESSRLGSGLEGLEGSMGSGANNEITARPARPQRSSSRYPGWTDEDYFIQTAKENNEITARPARPQRSSSRPVVGKDLLRMFREAEENAESSSSSPPSRGNQKESLLSRADQKESAPSIPRSKGRSGGFDVDFPDFHDDPCEGADDINAPRPGEGQIPNDYSDCRNCAGEDINLEPLQDIPLNELVMLPSGNCIKKEDIENIVPSRPSSSNGPRVPRDPYDPKKILLMNKYSGGKKRKSKKARKVKKTMKKHKKTKRTKKTKNQHEKINKKRKSIKKHLRK